MDRTRTDNAVMHACRSGRRRDLAERERRSLLRRYAARRSPRDLERLVLSYRPLACSLARRYSRRGGIDQDLEQAACEGLVKALQRYEPARGTPFTSFAVPTILGEIRRYVRDTSWPAHVPRRVQEQVRAIRGVGESFTAVHGRNPTVAELVDALDLPEDDIVEALCAASSVNVVPLEDRGEASEGPIAANEVGAHDPGYERVEALATIADVMPSLLPEELLLLRLHFSDDMTQRQIAAHLGLSRSHVGRVLGAALERLRQQALPAGA